MGGQSIIVALVVAVAWWPQPQGPATVTRESRLEALRPESPMAYFELAEEIADGAVDEADRALACHLFALAGLLDEAKLARPACLALADLEPQQGSKRRYLALAAVLDERAGGSVREPIGESSWFDRAASLAVVEALAHYRRGEGPRALAALRAPGAAEILDAYPHVFRGGAARFGEECKQYRNARRPPLSQQDLVRMLRFEAALLGGDNRTWSGELLLNRGRPLIEVDPDRLETTLAVDVTRPCYREGGWEKCEEVTK